LRKIHDSIILSTIEYDSIVYGSASKKTLGILDPINNLGLRLVTGAFCVRKIENILCESGAQTLQQRREKHIINAALKLKTNPLHPVCKYLDNQQFYDEYATSRIANQHHFQDFINGLAELGSPSTISTKTIRLDNERQSNEIREAQHSMQHQHVKSVTPRANLSFKGKDGISPRMRTLRMPNDRVTLFMGVPTQ
jgi:hypothetical protein